MAKAYILQQALRVIGTDAAEADALATALAIMDPAAAAPVIRRFPGVLTSVQGW